MTSKIPLLYRARSNPLLSHGCSSIPPWPAWQIVTSQNTSMPELKHTLARSWKLQSCCEPAADLYGPHDHHHEQPAFTTGANPVTQSMPAKYSNMASLVGSPDMNMSEALRANNISTPQARPNQQASPGVDIATGLSFPRHLVVYPYSQLTLPSWHFANVIDYPFVPQSYAYMPSAFQQCFHNIRIAFFVSSLPQSAAIPSGCGFGSSTSIPGGNYPLNPTGHS